MKKFQLVNIFAVIAALVLLLPGCSDMGNEDTVIAQTGEKIALQISVAEGYRTALPSIELSSYAYALTAEGKTDALFSGTYADLTKSGAVLLEAGSYNFTLTAYSESVAVLVGTTAKTISATDAAISFALYAPTTNADGSLSLTISNANDFAAYGVTTVTATAYSDVSYSTALDATKYALTTSTDKAKITGAIPAGKSYVRITLSDGTNTLGTLDESVYGVAGATSSDTVALPIEKYVATVSLTVADATTTAPTLTLTNTKNANLTQTLTTPTVTAATKNFTYTGLVPKAIYSIKVGTTDISGKTVANKTAVSVDMTKSLDSITAAYDGVTRYAGVATEDDILSAITITGIYKDSYSATASEVLGTAKSLNATVAGLENAFEEAGTAKAGTYSVTVTNGGFTSSALSITISEDSITGINAVLKSGVAYAEEDVAKADDVVVTPIWASGKTATACASSEYTVSPANALTTATTALTVTHTASGKTAEVAITVAPMTVYTLKGESAEIKFNKDDVYNATAANGSTKGYLTITGGSGTWTSKKFDNDHTVTALEMKKDRSFALKVKNVAGFKIVAMTGTVAETRAYNVEIKGDDYITRTYSGIGFSATNIGESKVFNTGSSDELTITISGVKDTIYIGYIVLYSTSQNIPAAKVEISGEPTTVLLLAEGSYTGLTATVTPAWTTDSFAWESSDTSIATIASDGTITFVKEGNVTFTAKSIDQDGTTVNASATTAISIEKAKVYATSVTLSKTELSLYAEDAEELTATVTADGDETPSNTTVTWTTSDAAVATVSDDGKVTAVRAGTATITATANGAMEGTTVKAECSVTVTALASVSYYIGYTSSSTLSNVATISDEWTSTDMTYTPSWGSDNALSASVNKTGEMTTYGSYLQSASSVAATDTITYTYTAMAKRKVRLYNLSFVAGCGQTGNFNAEAKYTVNDGTAVSLGKMTGKGISFSKAFPTGNDAITLAAGKTITITIVLNMNKATVWKSSLGDVKLTAIADDSAPDPNSGVSAEIGWSSTDITVALDTTVANKVNVTLPNGVSATTNSVSYVWKVDGETVAGSAESLTLSGKTAGSTYLVTALVTIDGVTYGKSIPIVYTQE